MCEYEVNRLTNEKVIRGKQNFDKQIVNEARRPLARPPGFHQSISRNISLTFTAIT